MAIQISVEILIFVILIILGTILVLRKLVMPRQYYEGQEFFEEKLRERISITPDYFGVIKDTELGDMSEKSGIEEQTSKPEEK